MPNSNSLTKLNRGLHSWSCLNNAVCQLIHTFVASNAKKLLPLQAHPPPNYQIKNLAPPTPNLQPDVRENGLLAVAAGTRRTPAGRWRLWSVACLMSPRRVAPPAVCFQPTSTAMKVLPVPPVSAGDRVCALQPSVDPLPTTSERGSQAWVESFADVGEDGGEMRSGHPKS